MNNPYKCLLGMTGCVAALAALWLVPRLRAQGSDSPIIVRDGSIVIENRGLDMKEWRSAGRAALDHPHPDKALGEVEVTGPGAQNASCAQRGRCVVEMRWSTGQAIRIVARQGGSRGLRLEASGLNFDDEGWDKSAPAWRFTLPDGAEPAVTIRDRSTNGQPEKICQGKGCAVLVHYQ